MADDPNLIALGAKGLENLKIHKETNELHYNGNEVLVKTTLSTFQKIMMGFVAFLGVLGTLMGFIVGFTEVNKEFCILQSTSCKEKSLRFFTGDGKINWCRR
jgi:hypothetical protein